MTDSVRKELGDVDTSQKAPSAKRCIKTPGIGTSRTCPIEVRKHRAPKGALRRAEECFVGQLFADVRKNRAPNSALRLRGSSVQLVKEYGLFIIRGVVGV